MLCKGNCKQEAKFGKWCCESYYNCPGYKKNLSDKAKQRGNYGIKGKLSKKYFIDRSTEKEEFEFICECGNKFKKVLLRATALNPGYKPICDKCLHKQHGVTLKENYLKKVNLGLIPYHKLGLDKRKNILWKRQNKKCNHCGYNLYVDPNKGPYQLHHIDGNSKNISIDNEEVLCCNCHYLTDNWGFRNRSHNDYKKLSKSENI